MKHHDHHISVILDDLRQGKMIILTDKSDREDEGDLVCAAEMITPETMNSMIRFGSGIVCLAMSSDYPARLNLELMKPSRNNLNACVAPFLQSIEAAKGVTTGVSATDRATTILAAIRDDATPDDLVSPGHVFPLQARSGGVFEREGHTEGSVDLMKIAGLKSAAVICELMNEDGTMMKGKDVIAFAKQQQINTVSIDDVIQYRMMHENFITEEAKSVVPLEHYGEFNISIVKEKYHMGEHIILSKPVRDDNHPPLVRIHSSCATGDIFGSQRCDCRDQLHFSLKLLSEQGGVLIYLSQEGRGIGLLNKIKSYALQDEGLDTVQANLALNFAADMRTYHIAASVLKKRGIHSIRLLTNNPHKVNQLHACGIEVQREPIQQFCNEFNAHYLETKKAKLNHFIQ